MNIQAVAVLLVGGSALPALADSSPTPEERSKIEQVLRSEGFIRWGEIESDDSLWEVDDARTPDGRKFEIKIDPHTWRIIRRDPD